MKPMLSGKVDLTKLQYPCWVSPKLDGIRAVTKDYGLLSRTLKPIPNLHVQTVLRSLPEGLDGELIVGQPTGHDVYNRTQSAIMTAAGLPNFSYYVFDLWNMGEHPFYKRYEELHAILAKVEGLPVHLLGQYIMANEEELLGYEQWAINVGFEGIMVRDSNGRYKFGRSTTNEGILLKMKRYDDSEAVIIGMTEMMHNDNEATTDNLGHTKRSSHQENKRPAGVMGNLIVRDIKTGVEFEIGTGFDSMMRRAFWEQKDSVIGQIVCYKYFPVGIKEKPRHPVYKGLRDLRDM